MEGMAVRKLALMFVFLVSAVPVFAQASDIYIAQSATGGNNGSSCANAYAYSFFNSGANWGTLSGKIGPGTTVHLCGTFSAPAQTSLLAFQGSGTSSSPITLLFEPGAVLQSPSWAPAGAIVMSGRSYIVVNGDAAGGRQGTIENTDEGTSYDYQGDTRAVYADSCTPGCTVENLTIADMYVHTLDVPLSSISGNGTTVTVTCAANCNVRVGNQYGIYKSTASALNSYVGSSCTVGAPNSAGYCNVATVATVPDSTHFTFQSSIVAAGSGGVVSDGVLDNTAWNAVYYGHNTSPGFTIDNVLAHDVSWAFNGWASNVTIENSEVYNADHGVAFGTNANASGLSIHGNHFHDFANWDAASQENHHDYIHLWDHSSGTAITGTQIYDNRFDGDFGITTTAAIFLEEAIQNTRIFNNICHHLTQGGAYTSRLCIQAEGKVLGGSGLQVYNNYLEADGTPANGGGGLLANHQSGISVFNNVMIGGQYPFSVGQGTTFSISCNGLAQCVDYNFYENISADFGNPGQFGFNGSNYSTLASWQTACSCDSHSSLSTLSSMLFSTTSSQPLAGSLGLTMGVNLTGLSIPPLDTDIAGVPRPATGAWSVGAYEITTAQAAVAPLPPTNLSAAVQ